MCLASDAPGFVGVGVVAPEGGDEGVMAGAGGSGSKKGESAAKEGGDIYMKPEEMGGSAYTSHRVGGGNATTEGTSGTTAEGMSGKTIDGTGGTTAGGTSGTMGDRETDR